MAKPTKNTKKITYKTAKSAQEKIDFAQIALDNGLYVYGWCLQEVYSDMVQNFTNNNIEVVLAFWKDSAIACALRLPDGHTMFFVKDDFRRMGIGTQLCAEIRDLNMDIWGELGIPAGKHFFESLGMDYC